MNPAATYGSRRIPANFPYSHFPDGLPLVEEGSGIYSGNVFNLNRQS